MYSSKKKTEKIIKKIKNSKTNSIEKNNLERQVDIMFEILKIIFISFLVILALSKIAKELNSKDSNKINIINVIEIWAIIVLTFFIYKIQEVPKMNIQEVLENYNTYKFKISMVEEEIQDLNDEIVDIKSANLDGMPKAKVYVQSSIENQIIEKQEKIEQRERFIKRLKQKLKIVEDLVKTLKKYNQDVIDMRYYQKISIEEIAVKKSKTYGAITTTLKNSITKMQREYNKNKKLQKNYIKFIYFFCIF